MADNVALYAGSAGTAFTAASDDIGGIHYQIIKLAYGALDTATLVTGTVGLPTATVGPTTGTRTSVAGAAADTSLLASNAAREAEAAAATTTTAGGGKRRKYAGYPRWVMVNGERFYVYSPMDERILLENLLDRAREAEITAAGTQGQPAVKAARAARVKIERRIVKVEDRAGHWMSRLKADDDEILQLLH